MSEKQASNTGSNMNVVDTEIKPSEKNSVKANSMLRDESRSILSKSNIGAQSMQKLTGAQSRAQLIPQADMQNEI